MIPEVEAARSSYLIAETHKRIRHIENAAKALASSDTWPPRRTPEELVTLYPEIQQKAQDFFESLRPMLPQHYLEIPWAWKGAYEAADKKISSPDLNLSWSNLLEINDMNRKFLSSWPRNSHFPPEDYYRNRWWNELRECGEAAVRWHLIHTSKKQFPENPFYHEFALREMGAVGVDFATFQGEEKLMLFFLKGGNPDIVRIEQEEEITILAVGDIDEEVKILPIFDLKPVVRRKERVMEDFHLPSECVRLPQDRQDAVREVLYLLPLEGGHYRWFETFTTRRKIDKEYAQSLIEDLHKTWKKFSDSRRAMARATKIAENSGRITIFNAVREEATRAWNKAGLMDDERLSEQDKWRRLNAREVVQNAAAWEVISDQKSAELNPYLSWLKLLKMGAKSIERKKDKITVYFDALPGRLGREESYIMTLNFADCNNPSITSNF